ncbi:thioredoxin domain-containing protein 12 [Megachile rotundata]|uniref:thioredoxin domain-containing protein 12 n=1 Tax=Megachile rotundata TaxID=143995 RepID=UPI000258DB06|nr:PREDICTED: thioredoxin domain-containing protein 12-like [Megachile rotundata]
MIHYLRYLTSLNLINLANDTVANTLLPSGFERLFKWRSFNDGFEEAKASKKPILLFIYKDLCPACRKLKQKFANCMRLMDLSDRFVMIKVELNGQQILYEKKFQPDGKYVPRILFYTADGDFIEEAYNKHKTADREHKFFYANPSQIVETMLYVLKQYSNEPLPVVFDSEQSLKLEVCDMDDDVIIPTLLH